MTVPTTTETLGTTPEETPQAGAEGSTENPPAGQAREPETFDAEYVKKLRAENAKHRNEAKANAEAAKRLAEIEMANATDLEKAVAKTRDDTLAEAARGFGERLARGVMKAQLEQSMKPADAVAILDDLNIAKFVGDDGSVDEEAIAKTVARFAPKARVDLGQGSHGNAPSFDQQIADATKAGNFALVIALKEQQHASRANKS